MFYLIDKDTKISIAVKHEANYFVYVLYKFF